jgi:hypothetical protein
MVSKGSRRDLYKPGEAVPQTGIYKIYHSRHRPMHRATLLEGSLFPQCKECASEVRFALARVVSNRLAPLPSVQLIEECEKSKPHPPRVR